MEDAAYALMASHETRHWWFVGRRAVMSALLDRVALPSDAAIVEAGCGTGGNLAMLAHRGRVQAFEPNEWAASVARDRNPILDVRSGSLPDRLPFPDGAFDLVAALDVLEHVNDDAGALRALVALAKPGGWILVTVPAHQILWGSHDRRLHHARRYGRAQTIRLARAAGAEVCYVTAFNTVLAPIAVVYRIAERLTGVTFGNQETLPARPLNAALAAVFSLERHVIAHVPVPIGLSYALILRRPSTRD